MKKIRKPLQLRTETVRALNGSQLTRAAGGIIKTDMDSACSYTVQQCQTAYCNSDPCDTSFCDGSLFC